MQNWPRSLQRSQSRICWDCNRKRIREWKTLNRERYLAGVKRWNYQNREQQRQYRKNNLEAARRRSRDSRRRLRLQVLQHYSPLLRCHRCDFSDLRALTIDHVEGHGAAHRRTLGRSAQTAFYTWLRSQGYPSGYQVLCMNCQFIKRVENGEMNQYGKTLMEPVIHV